MIHPQHTAPFRRNDSGHWRRGVLRSLPPISMDHLQTIAILHLILISLLLLIIY